ncbi:MAG: glycosyltransferase family 2 protein [Ginsengibacter sp.]
MNISVVIPVYNAQDFITKAVESALAQAETHEVVLVEDGSVDNSLVLCKKLVEQFPKVSLYTHPGNKNRGAGPSRNLGIANASGDFIAFLDADDYYLPDRFRAERKIFLEKPETDGVYGALGFDYYSEEGKKKYQQQGFKELTTLSGKVAADELFLSLLWLHEKVNGHFHVDTLTVKKKVFFDRTEMFNDLMLHEDTVFIIQLSLTCKLEPGIIDEPIAMRGVHDNNRIVNRLQKSDSQVLMWARLYRWAKRSSKSKRLDTLFLVFLMKEKVLNAKRPKALLLLGWFSLINEYFFSERMFFNPCCIYVFGKYYGNHLIIMKERILKSTKGTFYTPSNQLIEAIR